MRTIGHGAYNYARKTKCPCDECVDARNAHKEYQRQWRANRRKQVASGEVVPTHGKVSSYALGCRCEECGLAVRVNRVPARYAKYGLTVADYDALFAAQQGNCGVCRDPLGAGSAIDHDHQTGFVRGILCMMCNTGLGKLGDSIESLENALKYLRAADARFKEET